MECHQLLHLIRMTISPMHKRAASSCIFGLLSVLNRLGCAKRKQIFSISMDWPVLDVSNYFAHGPLTQKTGDEKRNLQDHSRWSRDLWKTIANGCCPFLSPGRRTFWGNQPNTHSYIVKQLGDLTQTCYEDQDEMFVRTRTCLTKTHKDTNELTIVHNSEIPSDRLSHIFIDVRIIVNHFGQFSAASIKATQRTGSHS